MRNELDLLLQARVLPTTATYTQRLRELQMALPPDQKRSQIHALNTLAEQLERARVLVASADTTGLVRRRFCASMLSAAEGLLDHTLEVIHEQEFVVQESDPQTSEPL